MPGLRESILRTDERLLNNTTILQTVVHWFISSFPFSNFALACTIIPRGVVQENLLYYNTYYIIYYIYYNIYNKYLKAGRYPPSLDFTF